MKRSDNSKSRQAALWQVFQRHSDDQHGLSMTDILTYLERDYDIQTTRQSVANDFLMLEMVLNIYIEPDNSVRPVLYYWTNRPFSAHDVEQLAESALTSPLLTIDQAKDLIGKLKTQCSDYTARHIWKNAEITKQRREISKETIEMLSSFQEAIESEALVSIHYKSLLFCKAAHPEMQDTVYDIYPYEIVFTNNMPAVIALIKPQKEQDSDTKKEDTTSFRLFFINRITKVSIKQSQEADNSKRSRFIRNYPSENIKVEQITLQCNQSIMPLVYDRFGSEISVDRITDDACRATVNTVITPDLFGWIFSFGDSIKLLTPLHATQRMKQWLKALNSSYGL